LKYSRFVDTPICFLYRRESRQRINQAVKNGKGFSTGGIKQTQTNKKEANTIIAGMDHRPFPNCVGAALRPLSLPKGEGPRSLLVKEQKTKNCTATG
ncbi:MAG: hypothetical protein ACKPKO_38465, partial [Candidatus Fonsibacter sp.]